MRQETLFAVSVYRRRATESRRAFLNAESHNDTHIQAPFSSVSPFIAYSLMCVSHVRDRLNRDMDGNRSDGEEIRDDQALAPLHRRG